MDGLACDIFLTLRRRHLLSSRRRYCPDSSCLADDIGQRPSCPATFCPTPLISPKRRNFYAEMGLHGLEMEDFLKERDVVVMNFWTVVVLFFMVMIFWPEDFLWECFLGLLWFFFFSFMVMGFFFFGMICGGVFTIVMVVNEFLVQTSE